MDAFLTQKEYFQSGATLPLEFRLAQLRSLYRGIKRFEPQILEALRATWENPRRRAICPRSGCV